MAQWLREPPLISRLLSPRSLKLASSQVFKANGTSTAPMCRRSHTLSICVCRVGSQLCDCCGQRINATYTHRCKRCDFDLCRRCFSSGRPSPPSSATAPATVTGFFNAQDLELDAAAAGQVVLSTSTSRSSSLSSGARDVLERTEPLPPSSILQLQPLSYSDVTAAAAASARGGAPPESASGPLAMRAGPRTGSANMPRSLAAARGARGSPRMPRKPAAAAAVEAPLAAQSQHHTAWRYVGVAVGTPRLLVPEASKAGAFLQAAGGGEGSSEPEDERYHATMSLAVARSLAAPGSASSATRCGPPNGSGVS
eukprot:TRINITY_DN69499_c0_g1_i1.p1 TRINITY_DN69499_c0_g1~~TRINITY_DN69499_c0_g1_i1.p1  ORF type:complete len:311 (-),score=54.06 TRINITY_DN69499_c0_g1_i1:100-1032(-)